MRAFLFVLVMLAGGCTTAVTTPFADDIYEIRYDHEWIASPGLISAKLSEEASRACPDGWRKIEEKRLPDKPYGATVWRIACIS